jgi:hypothetical protein
MSLARYSGLNMAGVRRARRFAAVATLAFGTALAAVVPSVAAGAASAPPSKAIAVHLKARTHEPSPRVAPRASSRASSRVASTGGISGTVTDNTSKALLGICVTAEESGGSGFGASSSASDGTYSMTGLVAGSYYVLFNAGCGSVSANWLQQWWQDASSQSSATLVTVTAGQTTANIDAAMQPGGTVTGTVKDNTGADLEGICVAVGLVTGGSGEGFASSGSDGTYSVTGLAPGSYNVMFSAGCGSTPNWITQWWENASSQGTATPISVTVGKTVSGIDASMQPGGTIAGTVKSSTGTALAGICVDVSPLPGTSGGGYAASASDGTYSVGGLIAGSYTVEFTPGCGSASQNWLDQWWKNASSSSTATPVVVATGKTVSGINASLQPGGIITGTVKSSTGSVLAGICVSASPASGYFGDYFATTGSNGTYSIAGLPTGAYTVEFSAGCGSASDNWIYQWWKNASSYLTATPVPVTAGKTVAAIDASMQLGGIITGTVKSNTGAVLSGICVFAYNATTGVGNSATSAANGTYSVIGLATGAYLVEFATGCGSASQNWLTQYWKASATADLSTTVSVTQGKTTSSVSPVMEPGGVITGTVKSSTGAVLQGICVTAGPANGVGERSWSGVTGSNGTYSVAGLPTGSYAVAFEPGCGSGPNWLEQWSKDSSTLAGAQSVSVKAGSTTAGVDAALLPGGEITGTVTAPGGAGLPGICVYAVTRSGRTLAYASSGTGGAYVLAGLPTGSYDVEFEAACEFTSANYATQWWNGAATQAVATGVAVTAGKTVAAINASMAVGGEITGTVTLAAGGAAAGVCVGVYQTVPGFVVASTTTASDGTYVIEALQTGKYILDFTPSCGTLNALPQYYKGSAAPSTATQVSVTAGKTTSGVSTALAVGGEITGTVKNSGGSPLVSICVYAYLATQLSSSVAYADTGVNGTYTLPGLPSGKYVVEFYACNVSATTYANQWYKGQSTESKATQITVTAGKTVSAIDATMTAPPAGGSITGTVTRAAGVGEPGVCVDATLTSQGGGGYATTGAGGTYSIIDLPAGTYHVMFDPSCEGRTFAPQWYKGSATQSSATSVTVVVGKTTAGISGNLALGGDISGVVKVGTTPLSDACIWVFYAGSSVLAAEATSEAGGNYEVVGLAATTYDVEFVPACYGNFGNGGNVTPQWWKGATTEAHATAVTVKAGADTTGISAALTGGGQIAGTVENSSGATLAGVEVTVTAKGTSAVVAVTFSGASGNYGITGLPTGTYDVEFNAGSAEDPGYSVYATQWWKAVASQAQATALSVTVGKTIAGINSSLPLRS